MKGSREKGSVTVEFAVIVPLLCLLILAVVEFGFRYERAAAYNNAAFIAARDFSINHDAVKAQNAAYDAGWPSGLSVSISPSTTTCTAGSNVTVTLSRTDQPSRTGAFGSTFTVTGKGVARCDN